MPATITFGRPCAKKAGAIANAMTPLLIHMNAFAKSFSRLLKPIQLYSAASFLPSMYGKVLQVLDRLCPQIAKL